MSKRKTPARGKSGRFKRSGKKRSSSSKRKRRKGKRGGGGLGIDDLI